MSEIKIHPIEPIIFNTEAPKEDSETPEEEDKTLEADPDKTPELVQDEFPDSKLNERDLSVNYQKLKLNNVLREKDDD